MPSLMKPMRSATPVLSQGRIDRREGESFFNSGVQKLFFGASERHWRIAKQKIRWPVQSVSAGKSVYILAGFSVIPLDFTTVTGDIDIAIRAKGQKHRRLQF